MKTNYWRIAVTLCAGLVLLTACSTNKQSHAQAIYLLVDTSGTYAQELGKVQPLVGYLLGTLNPGDSFAMARVKSRSFSEKDIVAKVTLSRDPLQANSQKRALHDQVKSFTRSVQGSSYTDITGGIIQAAEFLNETGAGRKSILIYSDMQEELDKQTVRDFPINLKGIRLVAVNVTKLTTDNVDPRRYLDRMAWWEKRVITAGASSWRVVNDMEHPERILAAGS
jgi:von Willebrand factor type A domain